MNSNYERSLRCWKEAFCGGFNGGSCRCCSKEDSFALLEHQVTLRLEDVSHVGGSFVTSLVFSIPGIPWLLLGQAEQSMALVSQTSRLWHFEDSADDDSSDSNDELWEAIKAMPLWLYMYNNVTMKEKGAKPFIAQQWFERMGDAMEQALQNGEEGVAMPRVRRGEGFVGRQEINALMCVLWRSARISRRAWLVEFCQQMALFAQCQGQELEFLRMPNKNKEESLMKYVEIRKSLPNPLLSLLGVTSGWPESCRETLLPKIYPSVNAILNVWRDAYPLQNVTTNPVLAELLKETYREFEDTILTLMSMHGEDPNVLRVLQDVVEFVFVTNHVLTPMVIPTNSQTKKKIKVNSDNDDEIHKILNEETKKRLEKRLARLRIEIKRHV